MGKDLKSQNVLQLQSIYISMFFFICLIHWGLEYSFELTNNFVGSAVVMAMLTAIVSILSNILPNEWKYSLVFFRLRNSLPGHRCKKLCELDPRISMDHFQKRWPELFSDNMDESLQNSYWYREIYSPVKNRPEVQQAHRTFLLYRDAASGLCILLLFLLIWQGISTICAFLPSLNALSFVVLILMIGLLCLAAQQSGNRMVRNALAVQMTKDD